MLEPWVDQNLKSSDRAETSLFAIRFLLFGRMVRNRAVDRRIVASKQTPPFPPDERIVMTNDDDNNNKDAAWRWENSISRTPSTIIYGDRKGAGVLG